MKFRPFSCLLVLLCFCCTACNDPADSNSMFTIYPNPTNEVVVVRVSVSTPVDVIVLLQNTQGNIIEQVERPASVGNINIQFSLKKHGSGVYTITLVENDVMVKQLTFIKV